MVYWCGEVDVVDVVYVFVCGWLYVFVVGGDGVDVLVYVDFCVGCVGEVLGGV